VNEPLKIKRGLALVARSIPLSAQITRATAEGGTKKGHCKPLPKEFKRDGFSYRQIAREGDAAIYEQAWCGCSDPSVCYEMIHVKRREGFRVGGRFVEPAEIYPNSEAWGTGGFTVRDKDAAFTKLRAR
jgi:hypothetical protein